eukprot:TRINITY_DN4076_c0_g1_i2.p1 TRINITY_DN4076_c0_g1~~TRINITY_DN4076_c0_g1_i2.p1  ORF type:complete len:859 (+),score=158.68 TRINITY_DN4076_c0_g1_i2:47-2623(+)
MRAVAVAVLAAAAQGTSSHDFDADFSMSWTHDTVTDTVTVTFVCAENDYCSIGIGTSMADADTVVCADNTCVDSHVSGLMVWSDDAQNDVTTVSANTAAGKTTFVWTRKLNTGDAADKAIQENGATTGIIWARGAAPDTYHGSTQRGVTDIVFSEAQVPSTTPSTTTNGQLGTPTRGDSRTTRTSTSSIADMTTASTMTTTSSEKAIGSAAVFNSDFAMSYSVDRTAETFTMVFTCKSGSYCSLGFGKSMDAADTVLCHEAGGGVCQDGSVGGYEQPTADAKDDLTDVSVVTENGMFKASWTRKLVSDDPDDVVFSLEAANDIIWATGGMSGATPNTHTNSDRNTASLSAEGVQVTEAKHVGWVMPLLVALVPLVLLLVGTAALRAKFFTPDGGAMYAVLNGKVGVGLSVLALVASAMMMLVLTASETPDWYWFFSFGRVAQLLLGINLILPAGPASIVGMATKIPHERVIAYHRWIGTAMFVAMAAHGTYYLAEFGADMMLSTDAFGHVIPLYGFLALMSATVLGVTSIPPVRRRLYHIFQYAHWVTVPCVTIFSILHIKSTAVFVFPGFAMLLAALVMNEWTGTASISDKTDAPDMSYTKLVISSKLSFLRKGTPAGGYAFFRFNGSGGTSHPFSIVQSGAFGCTIVVKNMGPGTGTDKLIRELKKGDRISVRSPGGMPSIAVSHYQHMIFVGGGVGITPLLGTLSHVMEHPRRFSEYSYHLVWAVRDAALVELVQPELEKLLGFYGDQLHITIHYTGAADLPALPKSISISARRPDMVELFATSSLPQTGSNDHAAALLSPTFAGPPQSPSQPPSQYPYAGVFVCGPAAMATAAAQAAHVCGHLRYDVHVETFEL